MTKSFSVRYPGIAFAALTLAAAPAFARDQIHIVGSSTVYPFSTLAAEHFGEGGEFKTPIIESTGTGGGFKIFCTGAGEDTPDINDASRAMTDSEKETCGKNDVTSVTEIPIGYDGIEFAASRKAKPISLTRKQLFLALGKQVPKDGKLVNNPNMYWSDVDPSLPKEAIMVYGPPPTSGTRDAFVELAFEGACKDLPEFKAAYPDEATRTRACHLMREDGKFIEAGEDDNLIIRKLEANPEAFGILGYSFVEENATQVHGMLIDGVKPTFDNIASGEYKLARLLYIYVKDAHVGMVPGLKAFAREITSEGAFGPDGYMAGHGLIPLKAEARAESRLKAAGLKASATPASSGE